MDTKHLNIRVSGRVQGVFFRESTRKIALDMGVKGFVRNEFDGTVYIEAEASQEVLDRFVNWVRQGPSYARVDSVEAEQGEVQDYYEFIVSYGGW